MVQYLSITPRRACDDAPVDEDGETRSLRVGLVAYNWEADTSLALWNLINYARRDDLVAEHVRFDQHCAATPKTAAAEKDELFRVLDWVHERGFDVVGFSCYIWNIKFVNRLAQAIKELWPHITVVYGGQQIRGFYVPQVFERERCVDICVVNEAEITFQRLLRHLVVGSPALSRIPGLAYWAAVDDADTLYRFDGTGVLPSGFAYHETGNAELVDNLDAIPSPYLADARLPVGGAFLYEASRGCPYSCSFCIWGESKGVREYPMDRVREELTTILRHQPSHIMFCDGTFNMRKARAAEILGILNDHLRDGRVRPFSLLLELKLELIDDALAAILDELVRLNPLVTVEFGMQSATQEAAELMRRPFKEDKYRAAWARLTPKLQSSAVIDCIYGLPGDGVAQFKTTVDFAYSLAPHRMQCFRLSILPGSEFERQADAHDIKFAREPDHMVHQTAWLSLREMAWLETFGFAVADLYHFHGTTIRCLLGLPGAAGMRFSDLVTEFVDWAGRDRVMATSYNGHAPDGRWRAINLSTLFESFTFDELLPRISASDPELLDKLAELIRYETRMGRIAIEGLPPAPRSNGGPVLHAELMRSRYDLPSFIIANRGRTEVDIADLRTADTHIALTVKAGHQDVRVPVSYRISERTADLLDRLRGQPAAPAVSRRAIDRLVDVGLLA
ncbi:B12-binding domain-containing radical SAM protein [Actinokineospora sp. UTMC 2448]|uniref:B12-binding domain-containing radical SAM protein n=1 Tax=Actinokineospora sp. UTMC 2448 TaxID=2268449 RepID=UPI0021640D5D|nr:radical SAM protein [Actinokineospora sp. UTMC 2448]UVS81928.1 coproporphyrinogen III oxidase [Actinokineospora sp. UTMC 2448]